MECYDPQTDQWTRCAPMKNGRVSPSVAVIDGMIYALEGGKDNTR